MSKVNKRRIGRSKLAEKNTMNQNWEVHLEIAGEKQVDMVCK